MLAKYDRSPVDTLFESLLNPRDSFCGEKMARGIFFPA